MNQDLIDTIEQAKQGSELAFTKLYNKFKPIVRYTIYNIVKNNDVTDDLLSVVFVKVYKKLDTYVNHISFEMWLKTIAVNTSIDFIRRMKKEQQDSYIDDENCNIQLNGLELSPEDKMILEEKVKIVEKAIPTLKKKYRDLINARILGLSYKEMADKLATNELTIKSDLNKARNTLKKKTKY